VHNSLVSDVIRAWRELDEHQAVLGDDEDVELHPIGVLSSAHEAMAGVRELDGVQIVEHERSGGAPLATSVR